MASPKAASSSSSRIDFRQFSQSYDQGKSQILWRSIVADSLTPVALMRRIETTDPWSFLLESVEGGTYRGRYSLIGHDPDMIWECRGSKATMRHAPFDTAPVVCPRPSLDALRDVIADSHIPIPSPLPPMTAGLFGYLSYDAVRLMEHLPDTTRSVLPMPDGLFLRPRIMAIFDNVDDTLFIIAPVRPQANQSARHAWKEAENRLDTMLSTVESTPTGMGIIPLASTSSGSSSTGSFTGSSTDPFIEKDLFADVASNTTQERYSAMVEEARRYILAGDIFQVVLSQRFSIPFSSTPLALYRSLRRLNPSPFLFCFHMNDFAIVGSSPEILVRTQQGRVAIRPIAGTRPRGKDQQNDRRLKEELLQDPKERAEHLMLLDLGRNDVARVAAPASVRVTDQMKVEFYSHVMHIVSHVEGNLRKDCSALDALIAGFPAGTVSGAPKIRAMEIIDELEQERRGIYAGGVGYFAAGEQMDMCIALRTAVICDQTLYVQAGAGIVADSVPEAEYHECRNKARALLQAAQFADLYAS